MSLNNKYTEKANWLKKNNPFAENYFQSTCQRCFKYTPLSEGAIHHLKYTGNDYKKEFNKAIDQGAIIWVCKNCHKKEHIAIKRDEVNLKIKHSGFCAYCEKFEWHAWFNLPLGIDGYIKEHDARYNFPICKQCIENLVKFKVLKYFRNKIGKKVAYFNDDLSNLSDKVISMIEEIKLKQKQEEFGSLEWLDISDNQTKLDFND